MNKIVLTYPEALSICAAYLVWIELGERELRKSERSTLNKLEVLYPGIQANSGLSLYLKENEK